MRVDITIIPGHGHFFPFLPLANALEAAGHEVRFATSGAFTDTVAGEGFECLPVGPDYTQGSLAPDIQAIITAMFVDGPPQVARDLRAAWQAERPDVVLVDPADLGAQVACLAEDIPYGSIVNTPFNFLRLGFVPLDPGERPPHSRAAQAFLDVAEEHGLTDLKPSPGEWMDARTLQLAMMPPSLLPWPLEWVSHTAHPVRPEVHRADADHDWIDALPDDRPLVGVTLGTLFGTPEEYERATRAALSTGARVIVVTKHDLAIDSDRLHVTDWVSIPDLAESCDVLVHHGGWGTSIAALVAGTPSVLLPMGADQMENATQLHGSGAGVVVWSGHRTVDTIAAAVTQAIDEPVHRLSALRLAREIEAMPSSADVIPLIEELAATGGPVRNGGIAPYFQVENVLNKEALNP